MNQAQLILGLALRASVVSSTAIVAYTQSLLVGWHCVVCESQESLSGSSNKNYEPSKGLICLRRVALRVSCPGNILVAGQKISS